MNTIATNPSVSARIVFARYGVYEMANAIKEKGLMDILLRMTRDLEDYDHCEKFTAAVIAKAKWMENHLSLLDERTQSDFKNMMALEGQTEWRSDVVLAAQRYIKVKNAVLFACLRERLGASASEYDFDSPHFDMREHLNYELCVLLATVYSDLLPSC